MKREQAIETIIRLVKENADVTEVFEDSSFMDDLDMASIEIYAFIGDLESEWGINIPDAVLSRVATVGELADEILRLF